MGKVENGKVEKAIVEGLEEIKQDESESQESLLDKIVKLTDLALSNEIRGDVLGAYDKSGMYNLPFWTAADKGGKLEWNECDMMPNGCEYKKTKQPHTHQIDVGIRGAEYAMQAWGYIEMHQEEPRIKDVDGAKYWLAEITFKDTIKHIEFNDFFMSPMMKKTHKGLIFDEYAYANAISKCMRKGILRLIPGALRAKWIKAYREGKEDVFTKESVREFQKGRVEESKTQPPPETEFDSENVPDNKELDNATLFNDWINAMHACKSKEKLKAFWEANAAEMKKHPAWQSLKDEANMLKGNLPDITEAGEPVGRSFTDNQTAQGTLTFNTNVELPE